MLQRTIVLTLLSALFATPALAAEASGKGVYGAGDPKAGKEKSASCAACHGADGNSTNPEWPKLAGQGARYLAKQLRDYRSGERVNATMNGMAAGLSDEDIEDLAAYYASNEIELGAAAPDLVRRGESLYRAGNPDTNVAACMGCHGPAGSGNPPAKYPSLSGQHAQYTAAQLEMFRAGERANDPNQMMRRAAARLTDKEIEAVSSYVEGLHR